MRFISKIKISDISIGLWDYDVIDGGILTELYPNSKTIPEKEILSEKIKQLIIVTRNTKQFRNDWSVSPIKIDDNHFYLYGLFTTKWIIISIQLPIEFSSWLINSKSKLILFESLIQNTNFEYLPEPLYEKYAESFTTWNENN